MKKSYMKKPERINKLKKTIEELEMIKGFDPVIKKYKKQLKELENEI